MALLLDGEELITFAKDVIYKISLGGFSEAVDHKNIKLTGLYTALIAFHSTLQSNSGTATASYEKGKEIRNVLEKLERICCLPYEGQADDLSMLKNVHSTVDGWKDALKGVHAYADASDKLKELTDILAPNLISNYDPVVPDISEDMIDYPEHVNKFLEKALFRYLVCNCTEGGGREHFFETELYLTPRSRRQDDNDIHFEMLFSAFSPGNSRDTYWHDILLLISSDSRSDGNFSTTGHLSTEKGGFCNLMKKKFSARLPCRVLEEEVRTMRITAPVRDISHTPAVPLESILAYLTVELKLVLAFILARSLWEFYDSNVIQTEFSAKTVHFMVTESEQGPALYVRNPCLLMKRTLQGPNILEYNHDGLSMHHYPKVLALGVMLVEIGTGSLLPPIPETIDSTLLSAVKETKSQLKNSSERLGRRSTPEKPMPAYWEIVKDCLSVDLFPQDKAYNPEDSISIKKRQQILYDRVVGPLENLLKDTRYFDQLRELENVPDHHFTEQLKVHIYGNKDASGTLQMQTEKQESVLNNATSLHHKISMPVVSSYRPKPDRTRFYFYDDYLPQHRTDDGKTREWMIKLKTTQAFLLPSFPTVERVKVAILDTGIDLRNQRFDKDRIREIRTWANNKVGEDLRGDGDIAGHGTHVADVLHQIAPHADIYIAQITITNDDLPNAAQIAKAITYAIKVWKVDIINMSFGYSVNEGEGHHELQQAIKYAHCERTTLFAAASNGGSNTFRTYPARYDEVICIHSSDSYGNASRFSPLPCRNRDNFTTLGEEIEAAWPIGFDDQGGSKMLTKARTGTSFATPIASGIAAILIQYARLHFGDLMNKKGSDGVKAMLRKISREGRGDYQYLVLDCNEDDNFFSRRRSEWIKDNIRRTLQEA